MGPWVVPKTNKEALKRRGRSDKNRWEAGSRQRRGILQASGGGHSPAETRRARRTFAAVVPGGKKDLPFIGETVLLERKPPRGESKAHDVGPLPGLTPGSHRRGSSKNNKTHPRTHPPPPAKKPKTNPKVNPEVKESGAKNGNRRSVQQASGGNHLPAETPRARHDTLPRQTARGQLGPALRGCDRSPRKEATTGGKLSPKRLGPLPGFTPGSAP